MIIYFINRFVLIRDTVANERLKLVFICVILKISISFMVDIFFYQR